MSTVPSELTEFVRDALAAGVPRERIETELRGAGWPREKVERALGAFAESELPVPVPTPQPYLSPREAFLYLLLFTALFLSAYHLGAVLFELIENAFPDPAAEEFSAYRMRWSLAYLIVVFPLYLFLAVRQERELSREPARRSSRVRQWLTYLTLFVAAGFVIGDLVVVIHHFLGGELTVRFVLKALVVVAIAGTVFGYYLRDLRRGEEAAA